MLSNLSVLVRSQLTGRELTCPDAKMPVTSEGLLGALLGWFHSSPHSVF